MDWPHGTEFNGIVNEANAVLFTVTEYEESPIVSGEWNLQSPEGFFVFVNVPCEPSPISIPIIVVDISK